MTKWSLRSRAEAALLLNVLVWGATFILVKEALGNISPLLFLAIRFSLASVALLLAFHRRWREPVRLREVAAGALAGLFLFSGYLFQTLGLQTTSAAKSAFLTGLTSVVVPLLAALVYRIRPQVSEVLGVIVATAGLALMTLRGGVMNVSRGDLLTVVCAVGFAAHIVTLGHFSEQMSFPVLSVSQLSASAIAALSLCWWVETPTVAWRPAVVWAILITGLLATALAFTIQAWAQRYTTSTRTALIFMLEPVVAWVTSYVMVGEGLTGRAAAGAALILGGVMLVEVKPLYPREHPSK
jgi:drug/metabolite transporter (DMT)-like permease